MAKKYFVFGKLGYEDDFVESFATKEQLEAWLINNEEKTNGVFETAGINAVVYGEEVPFKIVKRSTHVSWG